MQVEKISLKEIEIHPRNYKTVTKQAFERVKYQLNNLPQYKPIVVDKRTNYILGGNTRYRAAQQLNWSDIWVSWVETQDDKEAFEIMLSDNDEAGKADEMLVQEQALEFEIDSKEYGVNIQDQTLVADLIQDISPNPEEDEAPEVEDDPVSTLGSIYQLGEHRVMCGDSTDEESVELLLDGEKADMVFTDPPYGIGISANPVRQKYKKSDWDNKPVEISYQQYLSISNNLIIWGGNYFDLPPTKGFLVWDKKQPENFSMAMCEQAWTTYDKPAKLYRKSVTSFSKEHPTQKPVDLIVWSLAIYDNPVLVVDLFLGSGSTLIACEQTNRKCYGMELDPKYVDVIRKRYAKFCHPDTWEERWEELTPEIDNG